jgi:RimJ/RimL family protein N-acetyltransferase
MVWVLEDVAYFYGAFTFPEVRGQGLMTNLKREVVADISASRPPDHRCEVWVLRTNKANIRSLGKAGWKFKESFFFASAGPVRVSVGKPWI